MNETPVTVRPDQSVKYTRFQKYQDLQIFVDTWPSSSSHIAPSAFLSWDSLKSFFILLLVSLAFFAHYFLFMVVILLLLDRICIHFCFVNLFVLILCHSCHLIFCYKCTVNFSTQIHTSLLTIQQRHESCIVFKLKLTAYYQMWWTVPKLDVLPEMPCNKFAAFLQCSESAMRACLAKYYATFLRLIWKCVLSRLQWQQHRSLAGKQASFIKQSMAEKRRHISRSRMCGDLNWIQEMFARQVQGGVLAHTVTGSNQLTASPYLATLQLDL